MHPGDRLPAGQLELDNEHPALRRCWLPLALADEVDESPRRFVLLGRPFVAARLPDGLTVLADRCPHRLAPLSAGRVVEGCLECPYHGWRFARDGGAVCIPSAGPGAPVPPRARAARPHAVAERDGLVLVALEEPLVPLPEAQPPVEPGTRVVRMGPYEGPYGAAQLLDNQIDVSHFAFVHRQTFGSEAAARLESYEVVRDDWGFTVDLTVPIAARNDPGVAASLRPLEQHRLMRYRYHAPFHLSLTLRYPVMGGTNHLVFWVQPQSATSARLYVTMHLSQPGGFTDEELAGRLAFEEQVVAEDLALQARFDRLALPLGPGAECHVRSDRASVEYRRLLRRVVEGGDAGGRAGPRSEPAGAPVRDPAASAAHEPLKEIHATR